MMKPVGFAVVLLAILVAPMALAGKECEIDTSSNSAIIKSAKSCGFNISNAGIGKKVPAPKKLVIAGFQIRFDFESQRYGSITQTAYGSIDNTARNVLEFQQGVYQEITDNMYDMFVATLEEMGYEVVPREAVAASETYAMVKADSSAKKKSAMVRMTASGLKNIRGRVGPRARLQRRTSSPVSTKNSAPMRRSRCLPRWVYSRRRRKKKV